MDIKSFFKWNKKKPVKLKAKPALPKAFPKSGDPFLDMMMSMTGGNQQPIVPQGRKVNIKIGFTKSKAYYPISIICSNCHLNESASVKKGLQVGQVPCPKCGCHHTLRSYVINTRDKEQSVVLA